MQVTGKNGSQITISKPLYISLSHPQYRKYTFGTKYAGYEGFKVSATGDIGAGQIITLQGALFSSVKNVETYDTGSSSGYAHIEMDFSYGCEVEILTSTMVGHLRVVLIMGYIFNLLIVIIK